MKLRNPAPKFFGRCLSASPVVSAWVVFSVFSLCASHPAGAATLYWDTNGTAAGSGAASDGGGTWDSGVSSLWTTDSTGLTAPTTATTTTSDVLTFSAGSNGTLGTVTVSGTQSANTLTLNQAGLTFTGGTINVTGTTGKVTVNSSTTINSALKANNVSFATASQTLTLGGGSATFGGNGGVFSGTSGAIGLTSTVELTAGTYSPGIGSTIYNIGDATNGTGGVIIDTGAVLSTLANGNSTIQAAKGSGATGLIVLNGGEVDQLGTSNTAIGREGGNGRLIINSGTYNHSSSGSMMIAFKNSGTAPTGRLDVNGGTLTVAADLAINAPSAAADGGTATVNLTGGVTTVGSLRFGEAAVTFTGQANAGSGTLTMTGGSLYVDTGGIINRGTGTYTYAINLSGGTVGAKGDWSSSLNMALGTTNGSVTFKAADAGGTAHNISLSGALTGGGGLIKTGGGTLALTGSNTYSGGTNVNAGTLTFGNNFTMSGANTISIAGTGTAGTNYATVTSSALNTLTFGGTLGINITASLSGGETFNLFQASGGALASDFSLVTISGTYVTSLSDSGGTWTGSSNGLNFSFVTNSGILSVTSAIPEPSTYAALAGLAILGFAGLRRVRASRIV